MRFMSAATAFAATVLIAGCGGSKAANSGARAIATAPPPQTAVIRATATPTERFATPPAPPADVTRLVDDAKIKITELPREYSYGPFAAYQSNEAAVGGFDNPTDVLKRMNDTGREGGFVQSLTSADGPGGAFTIDVWKDASGAAAYFDQYPKPDKSIAYKEIALPQPLGEQSFVYQYQINGQTGYSLAWRRGRLILGLGLQFFAGKESLEKALALAMQLDQKAQAAKQ